MSFERAIRPLRLERHHPVRDERDFYRVSKRAGRRQLLFLPKAVVKLGLSRPEWRLLASEARQSGAAARHPFWSGLAVRVLGLAGAGFVCRRYRPVQLDDFDAVASTVEERLQASLALPRRAIHEDILGRRPLAMLSPADRARLERAVDGASLPRSSMHGDLHFANFVRAERGFRIIDWEYFDPEGSFVFDYIDFHIAVDHANSGRPWWSVLAEIGADHPAIQRAATATGVPAQALLVHFMVLKVDIIMERRAGCGIVRPIEAQGLMAAMRRVLATFGIAAGGADASGLLPLVALCGA